MRTAAVEVLMPLPLASLANCCFHASKPAAVLPHCAALTWLARHMSATRKITITKVSGAQLARHVAPPSRAKNSRLLIRSPRRRWRLGLRRACGVCPWPSRLAWGGGSAYHGLGSGGLLAG